MVVVSALNCSQNGGRSMLLGFHLIPLSVWSGRHRYPWSIASFDAAHVLGGTKLRLRSQRDRRLRFARAEPLVHRDRGFEMNSASLTGCSVPRAQRQLKATSRSCTDGWPAGNSRLRRHRYGRHFP